MMGAKSVLTLMMNSICLGVVSTLWLLCGYSETFGDDAYCGFVGDMSHALLRAGPAKVGVERRCGSPGDRTCDAKIATNRRPPVSDHGTPNR